jgi:hypothetical protein
MEMKKKKYDANMQRNEGESEGKGSSCQGIALQA